MRPIDKPDAGTADPLPHAADMPPSWAPPLAAYTASGSATAEPIFLRLAVARMGPIELARHLDSWRDDCESDRLYHRLAARIEALIAAGSLPPSTRLPAERRLGAELGVSRGTVASAYELLRERRLVQTLHGSGTVVLSTGSPITGPREAQLSAALPSDNIFRGLLSAGEGVIDMRGAYWFGTEALSQESLQSALAALARTEPSHGYLSLGIPELRARIARRLTHQGLPTEQSQIMITTGGQQAIALVAHLVLSAGDVMVTEDPTYPGALEAAVAQGARVVGVRTTGSGVDLNALQAAVQRHNPRLVYLITSVQNPTGEVMPGLGRQRLAEMVKSWGCLVIDDRALAATQFDGRLAAPLAAYADPKAAERIITIGSLSKTYWGGLRLGWLRCTDRLLARLARLKAVEDVGTPVLSQLVAVGLMDDGEAAVQKRRDSMQQRMNVLSDELSKRIPEWTWTPPRGGLCLWVDLGGHDAAAFARVAAAFGVGVVAGSAVSPASQWAGRLRLPYGQPPEVLREAAIRLADAWDEYNRHVNRVDEAASVIV